MSASSAPVGVRYTHRPYVSAVEVNSVAPPNPYAQGYGRKIPTRYRVRYLNRWRRVWVMQYANSGSSYITVGGKELFLDSDTESLVTDSNRWREA